MPSSLGAIDILDYSQCHTREELAHGLDKAMRKNGFIFIQNYGFANKVKELFSISEKLFTEEEEDEKVKCAIKNNAGWVRTEVLDPSKSFKDKKEGFNLHFVSPGPPPEPQQPIPNLLQPHLAQLAEFQQICFDFCQTLLEAFAILLKLPHDHFTKNHKHSQKDFENTKSILRLLHYPAIPGGAQVSKNRAGMHSDYGTITLLFQREKGGEGLQILPSTEHVDSENWKDVGIVEDAMLVNIGDALELWSGAIFKSTLHRVVLPCPVPPEGIAERFSIAYFNQPKPSASLLSVVPVSDISENDLIRMERKGAKPGVEITAQEHLQARLNATYNLPAVNVQS